ncbi:unnamed protein product [Lepidochelys kempii]
MRAYDYMCMGFVLRELGPTLRYWWAVYFCVHLGALGLLLLGPRPAPLCPPRRRGAAPSGAAGGRGIARARGGASPQGLGTGPTQRLCAGHGGGRAEANGGAPPPDRPLFAGPHLSFWLAGRGNLLQTSMAGGEPELLPGFP